MSDSFIALCIDLALCAAVVMSSKYKLPEARKGDLVYAYPSWLSYLLLLLSLLIAAVPVLPGAEGDMDPLLFGAGFWSMSLVQIGAALYIFRYRLSLGRSKLVIGALWKKEIDYSKIAGTRHERVGQNHRLAIRLTNGRCIMVSGWMNDLPSLAKQLGDRVSASGRGATSP